MRVLGTWSKASPTSCVFSSLAAGLTERSFVLSVAFGNNPLTTKTTTTPPHTHYLPNFISTKGPSAPLNFALLAQLAHMSAVV